MTKVTKESVNYGEGMARSHCGICRYYMGGNQCERVRGYIMIRMWCELFKPMEKRK